MGWCCHSSRRSILTDVWSFHTKWSWSSVFWNISDCLATVLGLLDCGIVTNITGTITDTPRSAPEGIWTVGGGVELSCEYIPLWPPHYENWVLLFHKRKFRPLHPFRKHGSLWIVRVAIRSGNVLVQSTQACNPVRRGSSPSYQCI